MMNVVVALFLVLSSLVVTAEPEAPTQGAIVVEHSTHKLKQVLDKARDVKEHAQEAVSEALSKAKDFVPRKTREVSDVIRAACRISYDFSQTTANKVSSAVTEKVVPTVNQYVPGERGRAKIGRFATSFVRNAAVYGLPEVLKYWVPARDVKEHAQEAVSEALSRAKDFVPRKTSEVSNKAKGVISAACRISCDFSRTAAAKVSSAVTEKVVPTVNQYVPDERGRAEIARFATRFVRNAAVCGLPEVLIYWVPDETAEDSKQKVKEVLVKAGEVKEHAKEAVSEALIKAKDVFRAAYQIFYDFSQTTATKVSSAVTEKVVPTVNQYAPDEQGRAKIGRFAASFVKNAAFYGLPEVFEYWVPGGVLLYNIALRFLQDVETEDYKQVETKTEHCNEELKKSQAKVNKLERKLSGGGENIQDDVKFERESSVGENNQANDWELHGFCCCSCVMLEFKCTPESRRYDQNVYDEGI